MPIEISHGRDKQSRIVLDVLGPTVEFLVLPSETAAGYCVLKVPSRPAFLSRSIVIGMTNVSFCSPAVFSLWST